MWPFRRRPEEPPLPRDAPAPAPRPTEWDSLPPLDGTLPSMPLTVERERFERGLASMAEPALQLAPLGHSVSAHGPAGVIGDLVRVVEGPASLALPGLPFPLLHLPVAPEPGLLPVPDVPERMAPLLRPLPVAPPVALASAPSRGPLTVAPLPAERPRPLPLAFPAEFAEVAVPATTTANSPEEAPVTAPLLADLPLVLETPPAPRRIGLGAPIEPPTPLLGGEPVDPPQFSRPQGLERVEPALPPAAPPLSMRTGTVPRPVAPTAPMPKAPSPSMPGAQRAPEVPATASPTVPLLSSRPLAPVTSRPATAATAAIPAAVRTVVERATGMPVADVPVHRGAPTAAAAKAMQARAFTDGGEVHLPQHHGPLETTTGTGGAPAQALLAHELVHVAQQRRLGTTRPPEHSEAGQRLEREAQAVEHAVARDADMPSAPLPLAALPLAALPLAALPLAALPLAALPSTSLPLAHTPSRPHSRLSDPGRVAVDNGIARRAPDGSVVFTSPPPGAPEPPAPASSSGPQRAVEIPEVQVKASVTQDDTEPGATRPPEPLDIDALYDKIRRRLKAELRLDRQRAGRSVDPRR